MTGSYYSWLTAETAARFLPKSAAYALSRALSSLRSALRRQDYRSVYSNLSAVFPSYNSKEIETLSRDVFRDYARYVVDLVYSRHLHFPEFLKDVRVTGRQHLDEALARERGVILVSGHFGNWEIGGLALAGLGYPIEGLALRHRDERIERLFEERRRRHGLQVHSAEGNFRFCYRILQKNGILGMNTDRLYFGQGTEVKFFGRDLRMPSGAARLALKTGAPILPAFFFYENDRSSALEIDPPLKGADEKTLVQAFADSLKARIRRYPTQWFVFQPFWERAEWPV